MSAIDEVKEKIAYLKVWLGIFVVTLITLIGWLVSNYKTGEQFLIVLDVIGITILIVMAGFIDLTIRRLIQSLREM